MRGIERTPKESPGRERRVLLRRTEAVLVLVSLAGLYGINRLNDFLSEVIENRDARITECANGAVKRQDGGIDFDCGPDIFEAVAHRYSDEHHLSISPNHKILSIKRGMICPPVDDGCKTKAPSFNTILYPDGIRGQ